jgi:hypothetical protein
VQQTLDTRIEAALPLLARIQQQGNAMKEAEIFESWINNLAEGTWNLPETPEQLAKLKELMSQELIVGPDAVNATEQLYDLVGDDELFDRLSELAQRDPRANVWNDTEIMDRLRELGIETDGVAPAGAQGDAAPVDPAAAAAPVPQQPVAEEDVGEGVMDWAKEKYHDYQTGRQWNKFGKAQRKGDAEGMKAAQDAASVHRDKLQVARQNRTGSTLSKDSSMGVGQDVANLKALKAKGLVKEQSVAEEINAMRKAAGLPVSEGRILDEGGETLGHIMDRFKHEVDQFEKGGDLDNDLYYALFDYYSDHGEIPYGIAKGRDGDPFEWVTDRLDQELGTGNYAPRVSEADALATFEVMSGFDTPVAEGSCNMTAEGEYCPEHALAECGGMYEMGTVAGSVAPVIGESQDGDALLARIKSLALIK